MTAINSTASTALTSSYLTFHSGSAAFAVEVNNVRFITSRDSIDTRTIPSNQGQDSLVFDYDGSPIPLYSFCAITDIKSQLAQSEDLIELLRARRQDHLEWVDALKHSIETGEPFTKSTDPHECAFGLWYDQFQSEDEQLQDIMVRFDAPHKRIHSLAETLLAKCDSEENRQTALANLETERTTTLSTLLSLFNDAEVRLKDMNRPVVMIIKGQQQLYGIQLDGIDGIKEFSKADWLDDKEFPESASFDGYFQTGEGQLYLNIEPEQLLQGLQGTNPP